METWRSFFRPFIRNLLAEHPGEDERTLNRRLRQLWHTRLQPYTRGRYPYRIWRDEIRRQLGHKPPSASTAPHPPTNSASSMIPKSPSHLQAVQSCAPSLLSKPCFFFSSLISHFSFLFSHLYFLTS